MSLPGGQQRALDRIEQSLQSEDASLGSMYAIFTRLSRHEAMPATEEINARLRQLLQPTVVLAVTLVAFLSAFVLGSLPPRGPACGVSPAAAYRYSPLQPVRCLPRPAMMPDRQ